MKFTLALAGVSAVLASATHPFAPAKSKNTGETAYVSELVRKATPLRKLEEDNGEYEVDISGYSVKFEMCQFVKAYDDDLAENDESETVLATKKFVVFRLCPDNDCGSCNYNYGEYMVDLETYLYATVNYQQEAQKQMCNACQQCGNGDDQQQGQDQNQANRNLQQYSANCDSCYDECIEIENMEENGYIDATNFLDCQMIDDPEDDSKDTLYAGPMCANNGLSIKIGVFTDEYCSQIDSSKDVDDYLMNNDGSQMKLSDALLKTVYADDSCVSCTKVDQNQNNNNNNDNGEQKQAEVSEMCQTLYEASGKCETSHGFSNGYAAYDGYENQQANEKVVCHFIESMKSGSYDEQGVIVVKGKNSINFGGFSVRTTGGQKFALTFFILGTVGLAVYSAMLHSKLTKGSGAHLISGKGGCYCCSCTKTDLDGAILTDFEDNEVVRKD